MVQPSEQGKPNTSAKGKAKTRKPKAIGRLGHAGKVADARGVGIEEIRLALCEKAWGYKLEGYNPREIADAISDDFNIPGPIHHRTIYEWLDAGRDIMTRKIGQRREEHIETVIPRTERQLRYWMPKANGQHRFAVARMEQVNGEMIEVIDDAVFKEEAIAAGIVLKTMEQQRKVLGVGLATAAEEADGKAMSLTQVQLFFQNIVNVSAAKPGGQVVQGSAVAIEAGDPSIDQL